MLNRLILIKYPVKYKILYIQSKVRVIVTAIWVIPTSVCLVLPLAGIGGFGYNPHDHSYRDLKDHPKADIFHFIVPLCFCLIPSITVSTCYALIYHHVRRHFKERRSNIKKSVANGVFPNTSEKPEKQSVTLIAFRPSPPVCKSDSVLTSYRDTAAHLSETSLTTSNGHPSVSTVSTQRDTCDSTFISCTLTMSEDPSDTSFRSDDLATVGDSSHVISCPSDKAPLTAPVLGGLHTNTSSLRTNPGNSPIIASSYILTSRVQRISQMEIDIIKNLFLVVCVFFAFLTPYAIALFIPNGEHFFLYCGTIVIANSGIHPVIYARRHPLFKEVFASMVNCRYDEIPEPSEIFRGFLSRRNSSFHA